MLALKETFPKAKAAVVKALAFDAMLLASKRQHARWVERGVNPQTLYDEVCSYFR